MSLATLDTHEVVKDLRSSGFTDEQAEALARNMRKAQELDLSNLATKADVSELKATTRADIAELRAATKADIAELRAATKADIGELRAATKSDIGELRAATKSDIAELKAEILKWMFGTTGFQTILIIGAVIALVKTMKP